MLSEIGICLANSFFSGSTFDFENVIVVDRMFRGGKGVVMVKWYSADEVEHG